MASNPTVSDLCKANAITDEDVDAAVDALLANATSGPRPLAAGYALDLKAVIQASTFATLIISDVHATLQQKQDAARTAILQAHPVKG